MAVVMDLIIRFCEPTSMHESFVTCVAPYLYLLFKPIAVSTVPGDTGIPDTVRF